MINLRPVSVIKCFRFSNIRGFYPIFYLRYFVLIKSLHIANVVFDKVLNDYIVKEIIGIVVFV